MQFKTAKTAADLPFAGVELVKVDKSIREVVIGGKLRIKVANTYSSDLELLVAAPFETATRHRVTATLEGFDPKIAHFEHDFDAKSAAADFEAKGAAVSIEKVEVLLDEAGQVVADAANDASPVAATGAADLPF